MVQICFVKNLILSLIMENLPNEKTNNLKVMESGLESVLVKIIGYHVLEAAINWKLEVNVTKTGILEVVPLEKQHL